MVSEKKGKRRRAVLAFDGNCVIKSCFKNRFPIESGRWACASPEASKARCDGGWGGTVPRTVAPAALFSGR